MEKTPTHRCLRLASPLLGHTVETESLSHPNPLSLVFIRDNPCLSVAILLFRFPVCLIHAIRASAMIWRGATGGGQSETSPLEDQQMN